MKRNCHIAEQIKHLQYEHRHATEALETSEKTQNSKNAMLMCAEFLKFLYSYVSDNHNKHFNKIMYVNHNEHFNKIMYVQQYACESDRVLEQQMQYQMHCLDNDTNHDSIS